MKTYKEQVAQAARQQRIECILAVGLVAIGAILFGDMFANGIDSVFGRYFVWLSSWAAS